MKTCTEYYYARNEKERKSDDKMREAAQSGTNIDMWAFIHRMKITSMLRHLEDDVQEIKTKLNKLDPQTKTES
jgi:outer membrane usher protein FimD/PapC